MSEFKITIIKKSDRMRAVPDRWADQYPQGRTYSLGLPYGERMACIRASLFDLRKSGNLTKKAINDLIGNDSWTSFPCDLCGEEAESLVRVGQDPDYEMRWVDLCSNCADKVASSLPPEEE